jgi:hypothetical protein
MAEEKPLPNSHYAKLSLQNKVKPNPAKGIAGFRNSNTIFARR